MGRTFESVYTYEELFDGTVPPVHAPIETIHDVQNVLTVFDEVLVANAKQLDFNAPPGRERVVTGPETDHSERRANMVFNCLAGLAHTATAIESGTLDTRGTAVTDNQLTNARYAIDTYLKSFYSALDRTDASTDEKREAALAIAEDLRKECAQLLDLRYTP
jgi:hypothetical protein